jgi:hypothetical protein
VDLTQPQSPVLLGDLHAEGAQVLEALDDVLGDLGFALDPLPIDALGEEDAETLEERLTLLDRGRIELGLRVDQLEAEVAEEEFLAERRLGPLGLTAVLGDLLRLLVRGIRRHESESPVSPRRTTDLGADGLEGRGADVMVATRSISGTTSIRTASASPGLCSPSRSIGDLSDWCRLVGRSATR